MLSSKPIVQQCLPLTLIDRVVINALAKLEGESRCSCIARVCIRIPPGGPPALLAALQKQLASFRKLGFCSKNQSLVCWIFGHNNGWPDQIVDGEAKMHGDRSRT